MSEANWTRLDELHPESSEFPARALVGGDAILVFATGAGAFRGVQRACPHLQASFIDAQLMANATMLRCSRHNYTFKLADGKGVNCPGFRIKVFEIKAEEGALFARAVA